MEPAIKEPVARASQIWRRYWFSPMGPYWLAMCRIFIGYQLYRYLRDSVPWDEFSLLGVLPTLPDELWQPVSFIGVLNLPPPSPDVLTAIWWITIASTVALVLGLRTRTACVLAAIGGLYLFTLPNCYGKISHGFNVLALMVLILPFCRAGAALSIDALVRRLRGTGAPQNSGQFNWPVKLIQFTFAFMLFFAGWHKLVVGGPGWVFSDNLRNTLLYQNELVQSHLPTADVVIQIATSPALWKAVAAGAMLGELSFIAIMFVRRWWLRVALFVIGVGFLLGLDVLMQLPNPTMLWLMPVFVNWNWIYRRLFTLLSNPLRQGALGDETTLESHGNPTEPPGEPSVR